MTSSCTDVMPSRDARVVIKGDGDESAVLCTTTATFALKMCDTSNSVLLVPPLEVWLMS